MEYHFQLTKDNLTKEQLKAKEMAKELLNGEYVFLDTETTGTSTFDEIVNLGISDENATPLYNEFFKPSLSIKETASEVSGITNDMVEDKPFFRDEWDKIYAILETKKFVAYNADFDARMIQQTAQNHQISQNEADKGIDGYVDAMKIVSMFLGLKPNRYYSIKLEYIAKALGYSKKQTHIAFDDVEMMVYVIQQIAKPDVLPSIYNIYQAFPKQTFNKFLYSDGKVEMLCKSIISSCKERIKEYIDENILKESFENIENIGSVENIKEVPNISDNEKDKIIEKTTCFDFFPSDYGDIKRELSLFIDDYIEKEIIKEKTMREKKTLIEDLNYGLDNHASIRYFKQATHCRSEKKMEDIIFDIHKNIGDELHLLNYINFDNFKYIKPFYENRKIYENSKDMIGDISKYLAGSCNRIEIRYFFEYFGKKIENSPREIKNEKIAL